MTAESTALMLARRIAAQFGTLPQVEAVTLAGSQTSGTAELGSDIDLYVYQRAETPLAQREVIAAGANTKALDNRFWEWGDEWVDSETGIRVDVMYRSPEWVEGQLDWLLVQYGASVGYSTCFWHNVLTSEILFDRSDWFLKLRRWADQPYPEPLRQAIVAKNHPILREHLSSYRYQIKRAVERRDIISVNHRLAALLASYFDILLAVNRLSHPGEKRLLAYAQTACEKQPPDMAMQLAVLLATPLGDRKVVERVDALVEGLDALLLAEGLL